MNAENHSRVIIAQEKSIVPKSFENQNCIPKVENLEIKRKKASKSCVLGQRAEFYLLRAPKTSFALPGKFGLYLQMIKIVQNDRDF